MNVTKVFFGREDRMSEFMGEEARVQYDSEDTGRLNDALEDLCDCISDLEDATEDYIELNSEEDDSNLKDARAKLVYHWTTSQAALSKLGFIMRIEGNEAFHRLLDARKNGTDFTTSDL